MKKILCMTVASALLVASVSSPVFARGGGGSGGDREIGRGYDEPRDDRSEDESRDSRTADLRFLGCDLEKDFMINDVCYDGRL